MSTQPLLYSVPFLSAFVVASLLGAVVVAGLLGGPQLPAAIAAFLSLPLWMAVMKASRAKDPQGSSLPPQQLTEVPAEPCQFRQDGAACCRSAGHNGLHLFKCASPACPGLAWPATSALPHPRSCLAATGATGARIEQPRTVSTHLIRDRLDNKIRRLFEEVEELHDFILENRLEADRQTIEELQEHLSHILEPK